MAIAGSWPFPGPETGASLRCVLQQAVSRLVHKMSTAFENLPLHPLVASAIARKGFSDATPVQAAMLGPEVAGRDLLVSARTGSGKTLAFAIALADDLLQERKGQDGKGRRGVPRALVVAPTRELAGQVGRELSWILADARMRLVTVTGGTPLGGDIRALRDGADVVVGTPGRLVDLHRRNVLDLGSLDALVLDEADEMLDMGFEQDLEYILGSAPEDRRTLMFSATMPRMIERMARKYQQDPLRIDVRTSGDGKAHEDISFVSHLVKGGERLAAVVNLVLCGGPASRAIVFCRTRERVGDVHQHLIHLGIRASAIAGDRSQGERDRALDLLRRGAVQVMVATDVAARGLDLPDVDRVIHADLPDNAETLTHRSGRTGRAGRKGSSFVIAEPRERLKAERQLKAVGVLPDWTPVPGRNEVKAHAEKLFADGLDAARTTLREAAEELVVAEDDPRPRAEIKRQIRKRKAALARHEDAKSLVKALGDRMDQTELLQVLLVRELERLPQGADITPVDTPPPRRGDKKNSRVDFQDAIVYRVSLGYEQRADTAWLLPTLCRRGGVTGRDIGAIRIGKQATVFEVQAQCAEAFDKAIQAPDPDGRDYTIERVGSGRADDYAGGGRRQRPRGGPGGHGGPSRKGRGGPGGGGGRGGRQPFVSGDSARFVPPGRRKSGRRAGPPRA